MGPTEYIQEKRGQWAESTLKSETARLNVIAPRINTGPKAMWDFLSTSGYGPYSRLTYWVRATEYWAWLNPGVRPNPFQAFREKNKRLFSASSAYQRKVPSLSYAAARELIVNKLSGDVQAKCLELLDSGMRWAESRTLKDGSVLGKGSKRRKIFSLSSLLSSRGAPYHSVRGALAEIGLTPHSLRKIYAAEMVRRGANPFQLMKLMGWSNLNTAQSYIEASDGQLEALVK